MGACYGISDRYRLVTIEVEPDGTPKTDTALDTRVLQKYMSDNFPLTDYLSGAKLYIYKNNKVVDSEPYWKDSSNPESKLHKSYFGYIRKYLIEDGKQGQWVMMFEGKGSELQIYTAGSVCDLCDQHGQQNNAFIARIGFEAPPIYEGMLM